MPYECSVKLRKDRKEAADQNERSTVHLKNAEQAYLEIADLYHFHTIACDRRKKIKSIEEIHEEVLEYVKKEIDK